ncbi:hypothetical protein DN069_18890 [Streptacidiphilus pinicola]|uniref:Uncharacterized protein n=1 Tax=Streptacidiphilus pinicola TaxID=2219663 RepID=A0A2X0IGD8_9ACTN|nr:hypothetical protein DN069_18890 [Streptacidiphilus pinicola]
MRGGRRTGLGRGRGGRARGRRGVRRRGARGGGPGRGDAHAGAADQQARGDQRGDLSCGRVHPHPLPPVSHIETSPPG